MAKNKSDGIEIRKFADHQVITQPNPLRKVLRRFATESAREEARLFCDELIAEETIAPAQYGQIAA